MDKYQSIITKNARETAEVGERVARDRPRLVCLYGELGSGKTTFTQGYAKGMGIVGRLLSPTFIIVRRYGLSNDLLFYHIDLYRLNTTKDIEALGVSEIFTDPAAYVIIEWADRLGSLLPEHRVDIHFSVLDHGKHSINFT